MPGLLPRDVLRARLRLYNGGYYTRTPIYWRARLVAVNWEEEEVTWEERAAGVAWTEPGGDRVANPEAHGWAVINAEEYHDFDITALVRAWEAAPSAYHGILIETDSSNAALYVAADNGEDDVLQQPYVLIDHTVEPFVDITNENAHVAHSVTTYEIGGTNSAHVVGMLTWSNSLMAGVYSFAAGPVWTLSDISLGVGVNVITVIGTNAYGDVNADSVSIARDDVDAGTGAPLTVITNAPAVVMNDVRRWRIGGTNNHQVVGGRRWENSLGGGGTVAAAPSWEVEDIALGVGGIPRGRITEVYGPESSGKTTICQHIVAEAQKLGGVAAFIDMEHALDPNYAARCGVNTETLLISQPDTGEQALEIAEALVRSGAVDVVVVDSVAALVPRAEIEGDMGDATMGMQARLMSQALRKLSGVIKQTNTAVIFTNQLRQKIGVMFGNPETTSGGMALKFYASVRLDVRRVQSIKLGAEIIGNRTRVRVVKNKVAAPFRTAEFDIMYNEGISRAGDLLDLATELEIITKRGSFYNYGDIRLGQGRENAKDFLNQNPDLAEEIELAVRQQALSGEIPLPLSADDETDVLADID